MCVCVCLCFQYRPTEQPEQRTSSPSSWGTSKNTTSTSRSTMQPAAHNHRGLCSSVQGAQAKCNTRLFFLRGGPVASQLKPAEGLPGRPPKPSPSFGLALRLNRFAMKCGLLWLFLRFTSVPSRGEMTWRRARRRVAIAPWPFQNLFVKNNASQRRSQRRERGAASRELCARTRPACCANVQREK